MDLEVTVKDIDEQKVDALAAELAREAPLDRQATVTQLHFDLQDYLDVAGVQPPISLKTDRTVAANGRTAIENMQLVFDRLGSLGFTAVLGFTYDRRFEPAGCGTLHPIYDRSDIEAHLSDLEGFLATNAGLIASWEAGFLGNWGEWGPSCTNLHNDPVQVNLLMNAIMAAAPPGVPVMMRYPYDRARVSDTQVRNRIGFHNNYFAAGHWKDYPRCTVAGQINCGPQNGDHYNPYNPNFSGRTGQATIGSFFAGVVAASPRVMLDAEMAFDLGRDHPQWGGFDKEEACAGVPSRDDPYHPNVGLNGEVAAQRLQSMHYTTMSRTHNQSSFTCWRDAVHGRLTQGHAESAGLPFDAAYFPFARSYYAYIRDHLGYRLRLTRASFGKDAGPSMPVKLEIVNDGFAAPHIPRTAYLVLLDQQDDIVRRHALNVDWTSWQSACSTEYEVTSLPPVWDSRETPCAKPTHTIEGVLPLTDIRPGTYSLGVWLPDPDPRRASDWRYAVRLANGSTRWSERAGVNVIATVEAPIDRARAATG